MTEYTTSSEAIREYLSARDRTANWVRRHAGGDEHLISPSIPPSIISDSDAPSYGPTDSDNESDSSLPPRMVLRWGDGRPDVPISTEHHRHPRSRAHSNPVRQSSINHSSRAPHPPQHHHHGPGTEGLDGHPRSQRKHQPSRYAQTLSYASGPAPGLAQDDSDTPASPEHILILPSPQGEEPPTIHPAHPIPRAATVHSAHPEHIIPTGVAPSHHPSQHSIHSPSPRRAYNPSHASRNNTHSPGLTYSHSHPPASAHGNGRPIPNSSRPGTALPYAYSPPQIIYAPSSHNPSTRYAPPQIVYSPPSRAQHSRTRGPAPSIAYSHSDPLPDHHNNPYYHDTPRRSARGVLIEEDSSGSDNPRGSSHAHTRSMSTRGRPRGRIPFDQSSPRSRSETPPLSDVGSRTSGSTYYILPTPGQKVQIIVSSSRHLNISTCTKLNTDLIIFFVAWNSRLALRPFARRLPRQRRPRTRPIRRTIRASSKNSSVSPNSRAASTRGARRARARLAGSCRDVTRSVVLTCTSSIRNSDLRTPCHGETVLSAVRVGAWGSVCCCLTNVAETGAFI
jgi:hypothetical protein